MPLVRRVSRPIPRGGERGRGPSGGRAAPASGRLGSGPALVPREPLVRDRSKTVWLFDLDNTLHDASHAVFGATAAAMTAYMTEHLGLEESLATTLRQRYWRRYGATLLGLVKHHGVDAAHFLEQTHLHPGLESRLRTSAHDRATLRRLAGRKFVVTNAPRAYTERVLRALRLDGCFDGVISIEDMAMFGELRPKPDVRMMRRIVARLRVRASDCVLVEDLLENQKAARRIGMRTAWMQRYLGGRWRGPAHAGRPTNPGAAYEAAGRRACPSPRYVRAKIRSLKALMTL